MLLLRYGTTDLLVVDLIFLLIPQKVFNISKILRILSPVLSKMSLMKVYSVLKNKETVVIILKMLNFITILSIEVVVKSFQLLEELCMLLK